MSSNIPSSSPESNHHALDPVENHSSLYTWSQRLEALALLTLSTPDLSINPISFRDELGDHRAIDPLLLAHTQNDLNPDFSRTSVVCNLSSSAPEIQLWRSLLDPAIDPQPFLQQPPFPRSPLDPLVPEAMISLPPTTTIEVWTESQLCALHAAAWHALLRPSPHLTARIQRSIAALIDFIQPDNATNLPWAIGVFLRDALIHSQPHSMHFAQTLLNNCLVPQGRPDRRSAWILLNASYFLYMHAKAADGR